jgi:hypothetical protein
MSKDKKKKDKCCESYKKKGMCSDCPLRDKKKDKNKKKDKKK